MKDYTTRRGKIARLPLPIREQLNQRLQNGEEGKQLLEWLNSLPETMAMLASNFDGQSVNEQNLSKWKLGGYRDWEEKQEALDIARSFYTEPAELAHAPALNESLAFRASARLALMWQDLAEEGDAEEQAKRFLRLCRHIAELRRGDHEVQELHLKRERLAFDQKKYQERSPKNKSNGTARPITREDISILEKRLNLL